MNLIAKNQTTITQNMFIEASKAVSNQGYKKSIQKLALFLLLFLAVTAIYLVTSKTSLVFLLGEAIFLTAVFVWLAFLLPRQRYHSLYQKMYNASGGVPERSFSFYETYLTVSSPEGAPVTILYADMEKKTETSHLWILSCSDNRALILDKEGFTLGDISVVPV